MGRGGATSSRGRGKFKVSRGGGRHFSRDLDPRDILKGNVRNDDDSSEEEDDEEEEESEDEAGPAEEAKLSKEMAAMNLKLGNTVEIAEEDPEENMTRAERKAYKKAQADAKAKKTSGKAKNDTEDEDSDEDDVQPLKAEKSKSKPAQHELSRKEREAAEKKAAQERYNKLHAQGKTAEAKSDLARLQEVRRRREQAAAQREAEAAEAAKEAEAKKTARK